MTIHCNACFFGEKGSNCSACKERMVKLKENHEVLKNVKCLKSHNSIKRIVELHVSEFPSFFSSIVGSRECVLASGVP